MNKLSAIIVSAALVIGMQAANAQDDGKLADTLKNGLRSYYTFSSQPFTDAKGGSTLQTSTPAVPAGQLIAADFLDPSTAKGGLRITGNEISGGERSGDGICLVGKNLRRRMLYDPQLRNFGR